PGGISGPVIPATTDGPASGRVPTASPNARAPTSVSDKNDAGLLVQNRNGTAMIPAPTAADDQRAQVIRHESERLANRINARPSAISEQNSSGSVTSDRKSTRLNSSHVK